MPPSPAFTLRPFTSDDYPAVVAVRNVASPEFLVTEALLRFWDESGDERCRRARWVAEAPDGRIVGAGNYGQQVSTFDPRRFTLEVHVFPEWQCRGVGRVLYEQVMSALTAFDPLSVRAFAREDKPRAVRFLTDRSFEEDMRDGRATLDLSAFDPATWTFADEAARAGGVTISTLAELSSEPGRDHKLHDLFGAIMADVPPLGKRVPVPFDTFVRSRLRRPDLLPDAYFIAVAPSGDYVGTSALHTVPQPDSNENGPVIATGVTGVRREWRRKNIALALKVRGIAYARAHGYAHLRTWNASHNEPILALNDRLGFAREPWRIQFVKTFSDKAS